MQCLRKRVNIHCTELIEGAQRKVTGPVDASVEVTSAPKCLEVTNECEQLDLDPADRIRFMLRPIHVLPP